MARESNYNNDQMESFSDFLQFSWNWLILLYKQCMNSWKSVDERVENFILKKAEVENRQDYCDYIFPFFSNLFLYRPYGNFILLVATTLHAVGSSFWRSVFLSILKKLCIFCFYIFLLIVYRTIYFGLRGSYTI